MENSNGGFNFLSANRVNREVGSVRPCDTDAPSHRMTLLPRTASVVLNFKELRESDVFLCAASNKSNLNPFITES